MITTRRTLLAALTLALTGFATSAFAQDASTLDRIKQDKQLRIGVTSAEPWFFKDPMTEKWTGVGVAMGEKLATSLDATLVPVETTWANAVAALQANQIDMMFVLDPTEERRKAIDFPDAPLFYYAMGALVAADSAAKSWEDIDKPGTRIGVTLGTSLDKNITAMAKNAEINRFSSNDEAIAAFAARRVDVVVQFHPALVVQYSRLKLGKVILPTPVNPVPTSAGLRKETTPAFRNWISEQFAELYKNGVPDQIFNGYLKSKNIDPAGIPGLVKEAWK
ncbi:transporter substrate-binding domain-containing protein [Neorhizobium sp. Rsf11]|uniref:Transporter substrate-binding domain-containing protein n=2 Tax=Neorhizobium TaxID=1525371 RepID=A0ABV0LXG3_9HYPH|nr:transporter substrate-binding domain-containing protein [Neorhizobium petrolearium]MCC2611162.1 transporter substrate-binding domain-containing protein [Neorhizobium petrolearium]WGI66372.1 transporter substrate-binding domain-containing protein [Neorhizobium petrolearium]